MRLLTLLPDGFPTYRPDVSALAGSYLPRQGIRSDLVTQAAEPGQPPVSDWPGGAVNLCPKTGSRTRDQLAAFFHDLRVLSRLRPGQYDAIQVRDKVFAAVFAIFAARRLGIPVFYWMSFPMSERYIEVVRDDGMSVGLVRFLFLCFKGYVGRWLIYRWVLPRCTHVFVQSERMREDVAARGTPPARTTAVPMGVDLERPLPGGGAAVDDERLRGKQVIAYLGSLDKPRRLEFLIDMLRHTAATLPDAMLLMIGDGPLPEDRVRLERHAVVQGVADRVVWTGWLPSDQAWRWLARADLAVHLMPRGELYDSASPTKVVEYLALGIPVVSNDQPDAVQVLGDSGAGISTAMELETFSAAVRRVLEDPTLAASMRRAGPAWVAARRSYAQIADKVGQAYRRFVPAAP